jgi:hypothetical protein
VQIAGREKAGNGVGPASQDKHDNTLIFLSFPFQSSLLFFVLLSQSVQLHRLLLKLILSVGKELLEPQNALSCFFKFPLSAQIWLGLERAHKSVLQGR